MRLTVSCIPESGIEEKLKFPIALNDIVLEEDVQVFLKASRFGDKVLVDGRATSVASLVCSRCLKKISFPVKVSFNVEYIPYREFAEEDEYELTREELDVSFYRDDEIDIGGLIREQMLLAVPMKPLCESDCRGICPKCGKNLNEGSCGCSTEEIDPRLTPLKRFKKSLKNRTSYKNKDA